LKKEELVKKLIMFKEWLKEKILNRFSKYQALKEEKEINESFLLMIPDRQPEEKVENWSEDEKRSKVIFCNFFRRGGELTDEEAGYLFERMKSGQGAAEEMTELMSALAIPGEIISAPNKASILKKWGTRWGGDGVHRIYERHKYDSGYKKAVSILLEIGSKFRKHGSQEIDELAEEYPKIYIAKERKKIVKEIIKKAEAEESEKQERKKVLLEEIQNYLRDLGHDYDLLKAINELFNERKNSNPDNETNVSGEEEVKVEIKLKPAEFTAKDYARLPPTFKELFENHVFNRMENVVLSLIRGFDYQDKLTNYKKYVGRYKQEKKEKIKKLLEEALRQENIQENERIKKEIEEILNQIK